MEIDAVFLENIAKREEVYDEEKRHKGTPVVVGEGGDLNDLNELSAARETRLRGVRDADGGQSVEEVRG